MVANAILMLSTFRGSCIHAARLARSPTEKLEGIDEVKASITRFADKYQHADPISLKSDQFKHDLEALLQDFVGLSDMYMANCRVNCEGGAYGVGGQGITRGQNGKVGTHRQCQIYLFQRWMSLSS